MLVSGDSSLCSLKSRQTFMDKSVSIVRVDTRSYRVIARENWGLTKEQMKGKHVHHRIPVSGGGTNDPTNLYVCSPSFHRWVWHDGQEFIEWASEGGKIGATKLNKEKDSLGRSLNGVAGADRLHSEKDGFGRSVHGVESAKKLNAIIHAEKDAQGKSVHGTRSAKRMHTVIHAVKDERGRSVHSVKNASKTNSQVWESTVDGFRSNAGNVAQHNRNQGWDPDARVRVR